MKARFIGNPANDGEGPRTITVFGVEFVKGEWVTIEDPATFARLEANSHWETKAAFGGKGDHDGDGKAGGDAAAKPKGKGKGPPDPAPEPAFPEAE